MSGVSYLYAMSTHDLFSQEHFANQEALAKSYQGNKRGRKALNAPFDRQVLKEVREKELHKQYYGIGEVAKMFHVNASLIRYWENEFEILKPKKNRKGDRLFRPEDIRNIQLIYHLLRERKYTIEGVRKKLKEDKKATEKNFEMVQSLQNVRQFLVELKEGL